jgi:tellurite resistance protein TerC
MSEGLVLGVFFAVVIAMLVLDLGIAQRRAHFPPMREALVWTAIWVTVALLFWAFVWFERGPQQGLEFITGYIVEQALSIDNVFVFIIIFTYFAVPRENQHTVLFWGVVSAIVFRAAFIVAGAALISAFHWILYLLGLFLIVTAVKLALQKNDGIDPHHNPVFRFVRKFFPVTEQYDGKKFFVTRLGRRHVTPLFLVLVMIETTDIAFATDSIPAIFGITQNTFIIFTSNIFAVLGLRSLYFVVAGFMKQFRYLKYGLSLILAFIGVKMLIEPWLKISIVASLAVIFMTITATILLSLLKPGDPEGGRA